VWGISTFPERRVCGFDTFLVQTIGQPVTLMEADALEKEIGTHPYELATPAAVVDVEAVLVDPTLAYPVNASGCPSCCR
jgi:hypothetical protein